MKRLVCRSLWVTCLLSTSCVSSHEDGDRINPAATTFMGVTANQGDEISIFARNQLSSQFELIHQFVASNAAGRPGKAIVLGGEVGYSWLVEIDFTQLSNYACYFGEPGTCSIDPSSAQVELQFKSGPEGSPAETQTILPSHEQGGLDCTLARIAQGNSWTQAGETCASQASSPNVLTLRAVQPACVPGQPGEWQQTIMVKEAGQYFSLFSTSPNGDRTTFFSQHKPHLLLVGRDGGTEIEATGNINSGDRRVYYTFDLTDVQGTIVDAQFRMFANTDVINGSFHLGVIPYWSGDASETIQLSALSTSPDELSEPPAGTEQAHFDDLGQGTSWGQVVVTDELSNDWLEIPLNAPAVLSLNDQAGVGSWSTGAHVSSIDWNAIPLPAADGGRREAFFTDHAFYGSSDATGSHYSLPQELVLTLHCSGPPAVSVSALGGRGPLALLGLLLCALFAGALKRGSEHSDA